MRRLLIRDTVLVVLVAVITLGAPLLVLARHQVFSTANQKLRQQTSSLAAEYEDQLSLDRQVDLSKATRQLPGDHVRVVSRSGRQQTAGPSLSGDVRSETVRVAGGSVTVSAPGGPTADKAQRTTLLVIGLALLAMIIAIALSARQARRLARPLSSLAVRARALGEAEFSSHRSLSGIPEVDAIDEVLERSSSQLSALVSLQREFASDAAHQLRTPLTGIGLRLEEIVNIGDSASAQEAEIALVQVERLNRVIAALLTRAQGDTAEPEHLDLASLVASEAPAWQALLSTANRTLLVNLTPGVVASARREHVIAILTSLLDNALIHGAGEVSITVDRDDRFGRLTVADSGAGIPTAMREEIFTRSISGGTGTGIGLALARSLAVGDGGTLVIADASAFTLRLSLA